MINKIDPKNLPDKLYRYSGRHLETYDLKGLKWTINGAKFDGRLYGWKHNGDSFWFFGFDTILKAVEERTHELINTITAAQLELEKLNKILENHEKAKQQEENSRSKEKQTEEGVKPDHPTN